MSPSPRIPFLIVGGGIGGLAAALALSRQGQHVHVIEKAPEFGELGAGLQLAPNAMRVLARLGVLDEVAKSAVYPSRLVWMDALSGEPITSLELGEPFRRRYGQPYIVMHRSDLLAALLAACRASDRIVLEAGREAVAVEDLGDGVRVDCADGTTDTCGAVVGADGLWSRLRPLMGDPSPPVCSRYVAYRGTVPVAQMSAHAGLDNVVMWVGPDMHFVQYPIRRAELYNQVAVFKSARYREDSDDWGTADELDAHYAQACAPVRAALASIRRDRRWPMYDRPPIASWSRNRITLLGDAAHPMLQYVAQGACQALEDALCLADQVARLPGDPARAFLAYQEARYLRTARVQLTARFFGEFCHVAGVAATLRNALMSRRAPDSYHEVDWLYGRRDAVDAPPA